MSAETVATAAPGLLFVPDISGFTGFVQATELDHSRHIIEELLDVLLAANSLDLKVSEIEGDAILFYRYGPPPSPEALFVQVEQMFIALHAQLRCYETQRICQCGACVTASGLTLKIIVHYGTIAESRVRDHVKLFGADVIAAHRLLKNDIAANEYALFTHALTRDWPQVCNPAWGPCEPGSQDYDLGPIEFSYVALAPLRAVIPEPRLADFSIAGASVLVFSCTQVIDAPLELVFNLTSNLPGRLNWMHGARDVEMLNDSFNRLGTKHRCVVDKNSPVMVTSGSTRSDDTITLSETDEKRTLCSVYVLEREGAARTRLRIDGFLKDELILKLLFSLLLKKKLTNWFQASSEKLKQYCEKIHNTPASTAPAIDEAAIQL